MKKAVLYCPSRVRATALAFSRNRDYSLLFSDDGVTVYRRVH